MNFLWSEFLALAEQLHTRGGQDEAIQRTIIGRAYYGAFGTARMHVKDKLSGHQSVHKQVIDSYKGSRNPAERAIGNKLDTLRHRRVKADYEPDSVPAGNVERALREARDILHRLDKIFR